MKSTEIKFTAIPSTEEVKAERDRLAYLSRYGRVLRSTIYALVVVAAVAVLLATLGSIGIPLEGLAFIAGVDRILDMARTALNVVGNALAVLVIAKWEHKFDRKKALAYEREVLGKFDKTAQ